MVYFNRENDREVEAEGRLSFAAITSGEHRICFDNTMSRWTAKVVSMHIPQENVEKAHENIAKLEHLGPVVDSIIKIADDLDEVTRTQHHMAVRERSHQDTQLSTNSRVHWMAAIESCVLIGMSLFQLSYVRNWLSKTGGHRRRV
jgi:p24 family protein beta-1